IVERDESPLKHAELRDSEPADQPRISAEIAEAQESVSEPLLPRPTVDRPGIAATPLARRMAAMAQIDLAEIDGVDHGRRLGKADIEREIGLRRGPTLPAASR